MTRHVASDAAACAHTYPPPLLVPAGGLLQLWAPARRDTCGPRWRGKLQLFRWVPVAG